jgi:CBS-domain-containing membrane protein
LLWTVVSDNTLREVVQIALGVFSFSVLAVVVHRSLEHPKVKITAALTVLVIGLTPEVTNWDTALLSESVSSSLLVLACAALLQLARHRPYARRWYSSVC